MASLTSPIGSWWSILKGAAHPKEGVSSTKLVYLWSGVGGAISAILLTLGFIGHSFYKGAADLVFAGAVGAMWVAVFGFATNAQNNKAKMDKEIQVAQSNKPQEEKL